MPKRDKPDAEEKPVKPIPAPKKPKHKKPKAAYNYVYLPNSAVFHRPTCRYAANATALSGCKNYKTAIERRRPCKLCNPTPDKNYRQYLNSQQVNARLLGGVHVTTTQGNIVGCCRYYLHPGKMTQELVKEHDCLGKACPYLERYENAPFWRERAMKKAAKLKSKELKRAQAEELEELRQIFQSYADDTGCKLQIIRLEKAWSTVFKVYYVSNNRFADGREFPGFYDTVRFFFPQYKLLMRHIRDENGRFVTIDEFYSRRKK